VAAECALDRARFAGNVVRNSRARRALRVRYYRLHVAVSAPDDTPTVTGNGSVEFESAGNGKFLSGTMSERVADDTHRFGERLCTFQMVNGNYHLSSPDSGTATISWKLNSGSDSHCGAYLRNLPNLGFVESARDYEVFAATTQFFLSEDGSTKWIGANAVGITLGVCRPAR
jgi:hypothetical protein